MNSLTVASYYSGVRHDAIALLPDTLDRILEVGCGTGATLAELKRQGRCQWAGGIEIADEPARIAAERVDRVWQGNVEALRLDVAEASLDALLCLDILEHLVDPWAAMARFATLLKPGAVAVISVPNVRNHRVIRDLLVDGRWDYQPSGIMDRTHLRFFTRATAVEMVRGSGLAVDRSVPLIHLKPWKLRWLARRLAFGRLDELFAEQFLIRARRP